MGESAFGKFDDATVREIFNHFAGVEVDVHLRDKTMEIVGGTHEYQEQYLPDDEPTIKAIADLAAEHGLSLRVWVHGTGGTFEEEDRLNVFVEEGQDGRFRVANTFFLG